MVKVADAAPALAGIVPRWEWRTFGAAVGDAAALLEAGPRGDVQDSDEIYLLSLATDASVKVRDGLMDVKQLAHVAADGPQQWRPVMKSSFPLAADDVRALLAALEVDAPPLDRDTYTLDEVVDSIVGRSESLRAVKVHKHRVHYRPNGCMAEVTEIRSGTRSISTLAVESEDAALVVATVTELGLDPNTNTCFARGLKELVAFGDGLRYGVIDVGTNSVKLHVGERDGDGVWRTVVDRSEITRLGEGMEGTGQLQPEPLARTADAIVTLAAEAAADEAVAVAAVGTAALRIASNSDALVDAVRGRAGIELEIIPGKEEARLGYVAAVSGLELGSGSLVVFETGGGSSQFTFGRGRRIRDQFSVDVGAVALTSRFGLDHAVAEPVVAQALEAVAADLATLDGRPAPDALVALGGAVTNLAAVKHELAVYDAAVVQGTVLDRAEIDRQIALYAARSADERRTIAGLQPKRAEVILAGACIVRTVLEKLGCESLVVSDRGLRHGLIVERFGR
jgi:exopolyphosphatase/guanosine-5'-triphosphate,3'-diphosphate pyrophosphatase